LPQYSLLSRNILNPSSCTTWNWYEPVSGKVMKPSHCTEKLLLGVNSLGAR